MLIVLTSERAIKNEADQINKLFENGLEVLHVRKPMMDLEKYKALIQEVEPIYHDRVVLHQYHELSTVFSCKGIHLKERLRQCLQQNVNTYVEDYKARGLTVSSAFHSKETIKSCVVDFDYVLLSPVFNSISKTDYIGQAFNVCDLKEVVVGMGGVNQHTLQKTFNLGYKGVGILGGIWNSKNPIESFIVLYKKYTTIFKQIKH
ncbi:thiamine phosphate synthase [Aquimarina sp. U1-2]|uniref:thiamine phosphate synthase n=1 Tax=Aquimarina sp. U1-2 TaxID=2823141 RepID=UPI001AEC9265|nr:thiamine phosphate synthase [Aquimarina sp. U1-2]MBP2831375.1 thiamine phosphate synthase [Aquimarina sp. U1-2]